MLAAEAFTAQALCNPGDRDFYQFVLILQPAERGLGTFAQEIDLGRHCPFCSNAKVPQVHRDAVQFMTTTLAATVTWEAGGARPLYRFQQAGATTKGLSLDGLRDAFLSAARGALQHVRPREGAPSWR
jgi:hypothetical protein